MTLQVKNCKVIERENGLFYGAFDRLVQWIIPSSTIELYCICINGKSIEHFRVQRLYSLPPYSQVLNLPVIQAQQQFC